MSCALSSVMSRLRALQHHLTEACRDITVTNSGEYQEPALTRLCQHHLAEACRHITVANSGEYQEPALTRLCQHHLTEACRDNTVTKGGEYQGPALTRLCQHHLAEACREQRRNPAGMSNTQSGQMQQASNGSTGRLPCTKVTAMLAA
jgi:hypothetical protein